MAARAAARVHRRSGRRITVDDDGSRVRGRRGALERAVGNLLENAVKFDADGTDDVVVRVRWRHVLLGLLAPARERQLDELVDQVGELTGLSLDVGNETGAGPRGAARRSGAGRSRWSAGW